MNVISLDEEAFYKLLKEVVEEVRRQSPQAMERWINSEQAMKLLNFTSPTTLQKLRDEGQIRYSRPMTKVILYDRESIIAYIEKHAKNTF